MEFEQDVVIVDLHIFHIVPSWWYSQAHACFIFRLHNKVVASRVSLSVYEFPPDLLSNDKPWSSTMSDGTTIGIMPFSFTTYRLGMFKKWDSFKRFYAEWVFDGGNKKERQADRGRQRQAEADRKADGWTDRQTECVYQTCCADWQTESKNAEHRPRSPFKQILLA